MSAEVVCHVCRAGVLTYCCACCDARQVTKSETPTPSDNPDEVLITANVDRGAAISQAEGVVATFQCRPRSDEWAVAGDVTRNAQGLVISRLELISKDLSGSGVTGGLLRRIQVSDILHVARAHVALAVHSETDGPTFPEASSKSRSGGRGALSDELLRSVAVAYLAETAPGRPAGAVKRMAQEFDRPEETVRSWIARARKAGWLGPSVKGRAGAEPGPRLRDLSPEEFGRIFQEGYETPPQNVADLAAGFESMSPERQRAASVAWFGPERQAENNRAALAWERQEQGRRAKHQEQGAADEEPEGD
ncbi:hypothetical protein [Streptomyces sp. HUAS TT20]|uniref:hypothetical protein n=1 Tax=Streptomyces sp. HUAS TT20 TaxID=3447509 RepID=UPI0021DAA20A|nr:hypothetical protein [Streptomyces sp. HUAS 15-9]UXY28581.1 hypothetical protein N8I87_19785 [Streptomyces sp. HUAS 15-9]